jgi:hypothetical protein
MRTPITLLLVLLLWPVRAVADERWYIFSIGGTPVGWVTEVTDGLRTRTTVKARLTRLGKSVDMRLEVATTEDAAGALQILGYETLLSKQPMRLKVRVDGDRVRILTPQERVVDRGPEPLLGPVAVARLTSRRLRAAGDRIEYAVFSPELQRVANVRRHLVAIAERAECGSAPVNRVEETIEGLPGPRTLWLDADAVMVGDSIAGPFGPMSTCRASKETALAANGTLPADVYEKTLATSNVRFADPFSIDRIVVRVRPRDRSQALPDFSGTNQRVVAPGLIEITRPSRTGKPDTAIPGAEFVESNAFVESANEEIARIAKELTTPDGYGTALALTKWTAENLTMDAGIVMAPASELVRDRRATCMGYATLLATLARAAGLPSRIVMGYVYYGGIWGGHAWTEMFVGGRWLPFDAAVFAPGIAGAARLSVGASSFADGGGSLTGPLAALFGKVDIETVEYERDGRKTRVESGERLFDVAGNTYVNRGLGLRIEADGWRAERAGSTWPSTLVVAFRRDGTSIELHQKPRYPQRPIAHDADAMFTSVEGGTLWMWAARGPDAAAALQTFLTRVERVR